MVTGQQLSAVHSAYSIVHLGVALPVCLTLSSTSPHASDFRTQPFNDAYDHMVAAVAASMTLMHLMRLHLLHALPLLPHPPSSRRFSPLLLQVDYHVAEFVFVLVEALIAFGLGINGIAVVWLIKAVVDLLFVAAYWHTALDHDEWALIVDKSSPPPSLPSSPLPTSQSHDPSYDPTSTARSSFCEFMGMLLRQLSKQASMKRGTAEVVWTVVCAVVGVGLLTGPAFTPWEGPVEPFVRWHPYSPDGELQWRGLFCVFGVFLLAAAALGPLTRCRAYVTFVCVQGFVHSLTMLVDNLRARDRGEPNGNSEHLYGDILGWALIAVALLAGLLVTRSRRVGAEPL